MMNQVSDLLKKRYEMNRIAISEEGDKKGYSFMGLKFQIDRVVGKNEGRKMLIDSAKEFLNTINNNPDVQPYLLEKPFTLKNIELVIFPMGSDGRGVYHPDVQVFALRNGFITYKTGTPEKKYGYHTVEKETFDEALEIVETGA